MDAFGGQELLGQLYVRVWSNTAALDLLAQVLGQAYTTAAAWRIDPVDAAVGNVRNDGPWLLEPGPEEPAEQEMLPFEAMAKD